MLGGGDGRKVHAWSVLSRLLALSFFLSPHVPACLLLCSQGCCWMQLSVAIWLPIPAPFLLPPLSKFSACMLMCSARWLEEREVRWTENPVRSLCNYCVCFCSLLSCALLCLLSGAIVLSGCLDVEISQSSFINVRCTPLPGDPASCDGGQVIAQLRALSSFARAVLIGSMCSVLAGLIWTTSPRQRLVLTIFGNYFSDWAVSLSDDTNPGGAGGILFTQLDSSIVTPAALAAGPLMLTQLNGTLDEPNTFVTTNATARVAMFGPLQASTAVSLETSVPRLVIHPGQAFFTLTEPVLIYALDAYRQRMTQNRALVVRVQCVPADADASPTARDAAALVYFSGSTLQEVLYSTGAGHFSDLRVFAAPGRYWLLFTLVSGIGNQTHIQLDVSADCPPAQFYDPLVLSCVPCPSDVLVYNSASNSCQKCPAGWQRVAANDTSGPLFDGISCQLCPLGQVSTEGGACDACGPNTYQPVLSGECIPCSDIDGLACSNGLAQVQSDFFAMTIGSGNQQRIATFQCPEGFCSPAAVQVVTLGNSSAVNSFTQCAFPRLASPSNLLCGECADGYRVWGNKCSECDAINVALVLLLFVMSIFLLCWLINSSMGSPSAGHAEVVLYFVQTAMLELGSINNLLAWLNVVLFSPNAVGQCVAPLTPYQQTQAQILMPLALEIELIVIASIHFIAYKRWGTLAVQQSAVDANTPLGTRLQISMLAFISQFSIDIYISASFSLLLFAYTQVAVACVSYLRCVKVGEESVVFSQPSMRCESQEYWGTFVLVIFALVLYIGGLPVGLALFLWKRFDMVREAHGVLAAETHALRAVGTAPAWPSRGGSGSRFSRRSTLRLAAGSSPLAEQFLRRYAPLFAMYSSSAWFWQVLVLARRTVFVAVSVTLLPIPRRRFLAFALSTLVSLLLQMYFHPFRIRFFNRAELASQTLLTILAMTLTAEDPPYSTGMNAFVFLLVVPPIALYVLYATTTILCTARELRAKAMADALRAQEEKEQKLEREQEMEQAPPTVVAQAFDGAAIEPRPSPSIVVDAAVIDLNGHTSPPAPFSRSFSVLTSPSGRRAPARQHRQHLAGLLESAQHGAAYEAGHATAHSDMIELQTRL